MTAIADPNPYGVAWSRALWPAFVLCAVLLVLPQAAFVWMSFHRNLGMGRVSDYLTPINYQRILTDPFYLDAIWVSVRVSLIATMLNLAIGFPTAYLLARSRSPWVPVLVVLLLVTAFVSIVVKVLGLTLILSSDGLIVQALRAVTGREVRLELLHNEAGVVIGLMQHTLPILIMLLISVIQTIPRSLEDAAQAHGASFGSMMARLIVPLSAPGLIAGAFMIFNTHMGAFTSAVLLGGGKVLTFPVLIQRKIMLDVDYAMGAALSTALLVMVFLLNILSALLLRRRQGGRP